MRIGKGDEIIHDNERKKRWETGREKKDKSKRVEIARIKEG